MSQRGFKIIGELINHSFARARRAWEGRDLKAYQHLARIQAEKGADYLTVNLDGTQSLRIQLAEMVAMLPELVPALQAAANVPLSFDHPSAEYHRVALEHYDRSRGRPILNSVAASRPDLEEMVELVKHFDTMVVVMASEKSVRGKSEQCMSAEDVYQSARNFVHMLRDKAGRGNQHIIVDPGLAPIASDTYGLVNMGLDAMRMIRADRDLEGVHLSVGMTNLSFGLPAAIRGGIENAYLTLASQAGLDFVLGNPEKDLHVLAPDDRYLQVLQASLASGRPGQGETQEEAGFRQAEMMMELY